MAPAGLPRPVFYEQLSAKSQKQKGRVGGLGFLGTGTALQATQASADSSPFVSIRIIAIAIFRTVSVYALYAFRFCLQTIFSVEITPQLRSLFSPRL